MRQLIMGGGLPSIVHVKFTVWPKTTVSPLIKPAEGALAAKKKKYTLSFKIMLIQFIQIKYNLDTKITNYTTILQLKSTSYV